MMSADDWAKKRRLKPEPTSAKEIKELLDLADQKIRDAELVAENSAFSSDHYQNSVYYAALPCATAVMRAFGYRVAKDSEGGHALLFSFLNFTVDPANKYTTDLNAARLARIQSTYSSIGNQDRKDTDKLLKKVQTLRKEAETWIRKEYPGLMPPAEAIDSNVAPAQNDKP